MDHHREGQTASARRSLKRKLEQEFKDQSEDPKDLAVEPRNTFWDFVQEVLARVNVFNSAFSSIVKVDRAKAKSAAVSLSKLAKDENNVDVIVERVIVSTLVKFLKAPQGVKESDSNPRIYEHELEKRSAYALGLLAIKPKYQQLIVNAGALPYLVDLLKREKKGCNSQAVIGVIKGATYAITNLALGNSCIQTRVKIEGGIPPLVELLEYNDTEVQRTAARALQILAFQNDENKTHIVECNALPTLILMLWSEDATIHYEAVGVIGSLVRSSPKINKEVLLAGALQPVLRLLRSCCQKSQREAALLIGQFAWADSDCKVHIVQRGAVQPLIEMLQTSDAQLREMSAYALGSLAQDTHNQASIAHAGGIMPLLRLLDSENISLQGYVAFALYCLADNEDNVADLFKVGSVQKLQEGEFVVQQTKYYVEKTLKRLEEKIHGRVLRHLLYLMRVSEKAIQTRVALALAHLCAPDDLETIFIHNNGLELLLDLLESTSLKQQRDGSVALFKLATKATSLSPVNVAPSPNPQVYLGEQYVNNPTLSDITFVVEGKRFYAHRICLLASSDAFRAMFDGGYTERDAKDIEIPNIGWDVFELMMRFIYTGSVEINLDISQDLLKAADQYLLDGLKQLCERVVVQDICVENVHLMYELSEASNAMSLKQACIQFILEQFDKLSVKPWYSHLIKYILPEIRKFFTNTLSKPVQANMPQE